MAGMADTDYRLCRLTRIEADFLTRLGLKAAPFGTPIPNYTPHFIIGNFLLTYIVGSTRLAKIRLGIDNNVAPREDLEKAKEAVKAGKITQAQLDRVGRMQAAHENGMEHFPFLVGTLLAATQAGVPSHTINKYALVYTLTRAVYMYVYVNVTTKDLSWFRSILFWINNITCIRLLWFAGKSLNSALPL
ncbi:hypothetical protein MBLNU459_g5554t2 [Dothideomycetes sp. NU459]